MKRILCLVILISSYAFSQNTPTIGVLPDNGPNLPATCIIGQIYFRTATTIGLNQCNPANVWTALSAGGGGLPAHLSYTDPTLTVSAATFGNGQVALSGNTSGTATLTAPAVAGTITNAATFTNSFQIPTGTVYSINGDTGLSRTVAAQWAVGNGTAGNQAGFLLGAGWVMSSGSTTGWDLDFNHSGAMDGGMSTYIAWTNGTESGTRDVGISRSAAGVLAIGNGGSSTDETGLWRSANSCRVTADITLTVNTPITICTWSLPAVAKAWAWQCKIPWVLSAGTGTNTLAIIANPSQTPTGATNGSAEIKTTNANVATEATTAISASGGTTLLTSPTLTPVATVFVSSTSGTLLASGTAGTFAIQMTAAGTTATAAAKAGATCLLY
jgi:hypothetical protein